MHTTEERFSAAFATMAEGVICHDATGRIEFCNPSAERILGRSSEELLARSTASADWHCLRDDGTEFAPEDHPAIVTLRTGVPQSGIIMGVPRPRSPMVWVSVNSRLIRYAGKPNGVVATFTDVTDQRATATALRESEKRYRSLFDNSMDAVLLTGSDGTIEGVNPAACRLFGASQEEICRSSHDASAAVLDSNIAEALRHRRDSGYARRDLMIRRRDGREIYVDVNSVSIDDHGRAFVVFRDVTDRKQADSALRQSRRLLADAEKVARIGSWSLNLPERHLEWSDNAYAVWCARPESFHPSPSTVRPLIHPDDLPAVEDWLEAITGCGQPGDISFRTIQQDGVVRHLLGRGECIRDESDIPVRLAGTFHDITDRVHAEAEAARANLRLNLALTAAGQGIWEWDIQAGTLLWDERMFELYRVAPQDFDGTGQAWLQCLHPADRPALMSVVERAIAKAGRFEHEFRVVLPGGQIRYMHSYGTVTSDASGRPLRMIGLNRDVTDARVAEERLKRLNHLYAVLSGCNSIFVQVQSEGELLDRMCRIAVERGEFQIAWVGRVDPATRRIQPVAKAGPGAEYLNEVTIDASTSSAGNGPAGRCVREGVATWCTDFETEPEMQPWREAAVRYGLRSCICVPILRRGQITSLFGFYSSEDAFFTQEEIALAEEIGASLSLALERIDLAEDRHRAEAEKEAIRQRLELAFDVASEGYWDWDLARSQCYISPRYYEILGYRPGEIEFSPEFLQSLIHPDDRTNSARIIADLTEGRVDSVTVDHRMRRKDGSYIWVFGRSKVVEYDSAGRAARIVSTRADVSEWRLLQQQYLQSRKMESVGRLAGGVAHDFNNILTVINGYSRLALDELTPGDPLFSGIREICGAGERAASLTRQLLAFSRRQMLQPRIVEFASVVTGMRSMLTRLLGEDIQLSIDLCPEHTTVRADPGQLEQVVMNLVINARDAMPGGGLLHVRLRRVEAQQPFRALGSLVPAATYVRLEVSDSGVGIEESVLDSIFEPFFTTKEVGKGTGLGLSTVQGIVAQSGGYLDVTTQPGKGTTFRIYLPWLAERVECTTAKAETAAVQGTETILVVEDEPAVREFVVRVLAQHGFRTLQAANPPEALTILAGHQLSIDLVLSDLVMPHGSGPELVAAMRSLRPQTKVLLMSGYSDQVIGRYRIESVVDLIQKPFTPDALISRVEQVLHPGGRPQVRGLSRGGALAWKSSRTRAT